jgi:hypothetical protein
MVLSWNIDEHLVRAAMLGTDGSQYSRGFTAARLRNKISARALVLRLRKQIVAGEHSLRIA